MAKRLLTPIAASFLALGLSISLSGCGGEEPATTTAATSAPVEEPTAQATAALAIELQNGVVGEKDDDDDDDDDDDIYDDDRATVIYGTLQNRSDRDVTITAFTTSLGDASYEIHEVVNGAMRQKPGGITIPAGGSHELKRGGDHLMIVGYAPEIEEASTVDIILSVENGDAVTIKNVPVRDLPDDDDRDDDDRDDDDDGVRDN